MASRREPSSDTRSSGNTRDEVVRDDPKRGMPLFPLIGIIIALLIGFLVFVATRSGPNYSEEQFTPDEVQEAG